MDKQIKERGITFNAEMVRAILDGRKTQTRRVIKSPATTLQNNGTNCIAYREAGDPWYKDYVFSMRNRSGVWGDYTLPQFLDLCPFGKVGDRLYVRETWSDVNYEGSTALAYRADGELKILNEDDGDDSDLNFEKYQFANWYPDLIEGTEGRWRPSIHMPRWASRITLEITDVRVERLHNISREDACAEGIRQAIRSTRPDRDDELIYRNYLEPIWHEACEWFDSPIDSFLSLWESIYGPESWQHGPWVWVISFRRVEAAL